MAHFGVNVKQQLIDWIEGEFAAELVAKYGEGNTDFFVMVAPAGSMSYLLSYLADDLDALLVYGHGDPELMQGDEGLEANVTHKMCFVARTGLPSSEACIRPDLVEPGDFPWEGAGVYRGYFGGVSGLKEESDWWVFRRIVDKLIELRAAVGQQAIQASKDRLPGMKYMKGELPADE
jgi:hypothetical protein